MNNPLKIFSTELDSDDAGDSVRAWIQETLAYIKEKQETPHALLHSIVDQDPAHPGLLMKNRDWKFDLDAEGQEIDPADVKAVEKHEKKETAQKEQREKLQAKAKAANAEQNIYSDYVERWQRSPFSLPGSGIVVDLIEHPSKPSIERANELGAEDLADAKLASRTAKCHAPQDEIEAYYMREVDALAASNRPSLEYSEKPGALEFPLHQVMGKDYVTVFQPDGARSLAWLFPNEMKEKLRQQIAAFYEKHGEGKSREQKKKELAAINVRRLARQREEHGHVLALEARGTPVKWRKGLSLLAVFQIRAPGVLRLYGKGTAFKEGW